MLYWDHLIQQCPRFNESDCGSHSISYSLVLPITTTYQNTIPFVPSICLCNTVSKPVRNVLVLTGKLPLFIWFDSHSNSFYTLQKAPIFNNSEDTVCTSSVLLTSNTINCTFCWENKVLHQIKRDCMIHVF